MILYLSDTGNTGWAAKAIAEATGDKLLFIPDLIRNGQYDFTLAHEERLGICFPVHGWRPPLIVRKYIRRLSVNANDNYVYSLCTAGDNIGETMDILRHDLTNISLHLDATFSLIMPESYLGLPFFNVDNAKKEKAKKEQASKELREYIKEIIGRKEARHLTIGHWPRINSRILGGFFTRHLITDKKFTVDSYKCTKCGLCSNVCPTKNIIGGRGLAPQWKHDGSCIACFACYHHCPSHAIDYGFLTKNKGQYYFGMKKTSK